MEPTNTPERTACSISAARRTSALALAAALLFTSLFVDVGVARAEYPAGWEDPDLGELGACVITCAGFFSAKTAALKYGLGAACLSCAWNQFLEINDWMQTVDGETCYTGVLGNPCSGPEYPEYLPR
jgi:hypothetical protein